MRRSATWTHASTGSRSGSTEPRSVVGGYVDGDGKARGFLLWDVWDKVDSARGLIEAGTTVDAAALRALID